MKKSFSYMLVMFSFLALGACNNSGKSSKQKADSTNQANKPMASNQDASFMTKAAIGGMMEIKMGQVAQERGTNSRIKSFGAMMVNDHSDINSTLKMLAEKKGVALPDSLDNSHQADIENLINDKPSKFDKDYIDEMVKDHKNDIKDFQDAQSNVQDSMLKAFITQTLPTLQKHLNAAESIQSALENKH